MAMVCASNEVDEVFHTSREKFGIGGFMAVTLHLTQALSVDDEKYAGGRELNGKAEGERAF